MLLGGTDSVQTWVFFRSFLREEVVKWFNVCVRKGGMVEEASVTAKSNQIRDLKSCFKVQKLCQQPFFKVSKQKHLAKQMVLCVYILMNDNSIFAAVVGHSQ